MATTETAVLDRVRAVCAAAELVEAPGVLSFDLSPAQAADGHFTATFEGQTPVGGMNFSEETTGAIEVSVLRTVNGNYDATRRALMDELTALLALIVRDGCGDGQYSVTDGNRRLVIEAPKGAAFLIGRLSVGVNFESQL